jgi:hypothetical protein
MNILNDCSFLPKEAIEKIEKKYNATYVFESCIKDKKGNWCNSPTAIFYAEEAHPEGSNYFAIYPDYQSNAYMITNAITAVTDPFDAVLVDEEVIYSRYRHDYREHKGVFVDGGRDYTRCGGSNMSDIKIVTLKVEKDKLVIDKKG